MTSDLSSTSAVAALAWPSMRFTVDGWDPAYGTSLELEDYLEESTAAVDVAVELPADRWRAIGGGGAVPPAALPVTWQAGYSPAHVTMSLACGATVKSPRLRSTETR